MSVTQILSLSDLQSAADAYVVKASHDYATARFKEEAAKQDTAASSGGQRMLSDGYWQDRRLAEDT